MTARAISTDPFGLTTFGAADLVERPGIKYRHAMGRLPTWVADMDFPIAPAIIERIQDRIARDVGYPDWPTLGRSYLPERFAERMNERFGWAIDPVRTRELADVMQGLEIVIHHLTEPGDGIVLHTPSYPPFLGTIARSGRRLVAIPAASTDAGYEWDYDELERRLVAGPARILLLCHPQNPTGRVFALAELERIADLAERHDLIVVSDEIHAELVHPPHGHVPFATVTPDAADRTVTITSSSKAFNLAGLRWAIMHIGVDRLHELFTAMPVHYFGSPNLLAVEATDAAWSQGDDWQRAVARQLDENRHRLSELLSTHLPGVRYHVPQATYLAWLDCRELGLGDDPALTFRDRGVEIYSGLKFGPLGTGHVRLNFATSPAVLEATVRAMAGEHDGDQPH